MQREDLKEPMQKREQRKNGRGKRRREKGKEKLQRERVPFKNKTRDFDFITCVFKYHPKHTYIYRE